MKRLLTYGSAVIMTVFVAVFAFHNIRLAERAMGPTFKPVIPTIGADGITRFVAPDAALAAGVNINTVPAAAGTAGGTATCNWNVSPYCRVSATYGAGFIAFSNPVDGSQYTLEVDQDSTGRVETLPTGTPAVVLPGTTTGVTLSTVASNVEVVNMVFNAASGNYIVNSVMNNPVTLTSCAGTANPGSAVTGVATVTNACLSGATIVGCNIVNPATPGQAPPACSVSSGTLTILVTSTNLGPTPTVAWYRIK